MKIAIASDHRGYEVKEKIKEYLENSHKLIDFGPLEKVDSVDYPDFVIPACESVVNGENERAILICGTGIGVSMAANKVSGIRGALVYNKHSAESSRLHNNANAICLAADEFTDEELISFINIWLNTDFSNDGRHVRRLQKIEDIK